MPKTKKRLYTFLVLLTAILVTAFMFTDNPLTNTVSKVVSGNSSQSGEYDTQIVQNAEAMIHNGRDIFRNDTFGDEEFWGDTLKLHQAIAGAGLGGVGAGVSPELALQVGLKVDSEALPSSLLRDLKKNKVNLKSPQSTLLLLKHNAVVGVKGFFDPAGKLVSIGITCAFCHSTVDDSIMPGIGKRLDGWANRDLNVGAIVALSPNLQPFTKLLGVDEATVRKVLASWGPGKYDAILVLDGKAFRPDGGSAAVLIPPAYGLAGINLHTWTGWGSVPYWNVFVAKLQMHGKGRFYDARINNPAKYPIGAREGFYNISDKPDLITSKLPALHYYQLSLPAPKPPAGSFDKESAKRGEVLFNGKGKCAECHVPPIFTEPGHNLHTPARMGIDSFQADRSPTGRYRTAPLKGLWAHQKGGFFHDGRFATLLDVVNHYNKIYDLKLSEAEKQSLVEYLKSL